MSNLPFNLRFNLENEQGETFVTCELTNTNAREYIYLQANEQLTFENMRESLDKYFELLNITQCPHLIIDTRKYDGAWGELNDYLENELGIAKAKGLRYCAHIVPRGLARSPISTDTKDALEKNDISYETFTGAATAVGWVEICDENI